MRRPDTFIIGAAKCGTTSVWDWLDGHPDVFMSPRKEPRYFAPDLPSGVDGKNLAHGRDLDRYLDLFGDANGEARLGEASVRYIFSKQAPQLIRDFTPRPYIVAMIREPVAMMHSLHGHHVAGGTETLDFEAALAAEEERLAGEAAGAHGNPRLMAYRARARFGEQLTPWFETFDRSRIHVIVLEDMIADTPGTFRRLLEFLEVDPDYQPQSFEARNPRHAARSTAVRSVLTSPVPQWVVWKMLPKTLGDRRARRMLDPFRRINRRRAEKTHVDPQLRKRLQADMAEDVARLSELLQRDLAQLWWGSRG